ncbi:hypothetical protein Q427_18645 [Halomonas sp. BC04]|nr:hypothetical protein Q427_18645 [Halomonas sp. BC04]
MTFTAPSLGQWFRSAVPHLSRRKPAWLSRWDKWDRWDRWDTPRNLGQQDKDGPAHGVETLLAALADAGRDLVPDLERQLR